MQVSALKQAALLSSQHSGSTIWHLYLSLHSDIRRTNPRYPVLFCIWIPDDLTTFLVAGSDRMCSWSRNSQFLPLLHTDFVQPAIICSYIPWGSYQRGTGLDYNTSCGIWRAAVPVSDCISTPLNYQYSRTLTLSVRHIYARRNAAR